MSYTICNFNGTNHQITIKHRNGLLTAFYYELEEGGLKFKECFSDVCSDETAYAESLRRVLSEAEKATGLVLMKVKTSK
jgi:hypothetical protein